MEAAVVRRLTIAVSWALARGATLDTLENYEASYALNEEFREWLLCLDEHPELILDTVLMVPKSFDQRLRSGPRQSETLQTEWDDLLEI